MAENHPLKTAKPDVFYPMFANGVHIFTNYGLTLEKK